jgi:tRNA(adenine34) deaminase
MIAHEMWMARAVDEAKAAARDGEAPIAAIVVQGDTVLGVGRNTKTSERCGFMHAELNALLAARPLLGRRPEGVVLYSTLEPCAMCLGAIVFSGIRTLVYGASDAVGAVAMFREHPRYGEWMPEVIGGVLVDQCEALIALPTFTGAGSNTRSR